MVGLDEQKRDAAGRSVAFDLPRCTVYRGREGLTFTDHRDPEPDMESRLDPERLTPAYRRYVEQELHSNHVRVERQIALLEDVLDGLEGKRLLDVGAGGGLMMEAAAACGADVEGLEPHDRFLLYARERGLRVHHATAEQYARDPGRLASYDAITLWDVLEHVNEPDSTLAACRALLRPGGVLLLDTPLREGAFHRLGERLYRGTGGRLTRVLQLMYGGHDYGHKQILSQEEVRAALERAGLSVQRVQAFHELAQPLRSYLIRLVRSERIARALVPPTRAVLDTFPPSNKVLAIARRC